MNDLGFIKVATVTPMLKVANTKYNTEEIIRCAKEADAAGAAVVLFPELSITGYTCADLFYQLTLYENNLSGLKTIIESSASFDAALIVGFYLRIENNFYNCGALIQKGKLCGVVPKMFPPNDREFYEARWFAAGIRISEEIHSIPLFGEDIPFGNLIFTDEKSQLKLGIEICEDLWMPITPGSRLCLNGAHIIFNPSASDETVGKADYRRQLILQQSASNGCGYVYCSSGVWESTTDVVYSGHCIIAENGSKLMESDRFVRESNITYADIDYHRLTYQRTHQYHLESCSSAYGGRQSYRTVFLQPLKIFDPKKHTLLRTYEKNPFIPGDPSTVDMRCREIFQIQSSGLAKRIAHTGVETAIVGISGGLDSTLALLVCVETYKKINKDPKKIIAVTMPGFGTTGKTYNNALNIMKLLGVDIREIPIGDAVLHHFEAIGHDPQIHDVTYENSQARERTQILMDLSNKENGLVVGTGDLSEVALGWSTYNGDHMSMYGVNCSVPKTLVRFVIKWVIENRLKGPEEDHTFSSDNALLAKILQDIMETPISPELLPPDEKGEIAQKTEDTVGPYILHDFFLYYTIRFGMNPKKLLYIATEVFRDDYDRDFIKKWLKTFYRRFFIQQFKRSCIPDGPKVGSVSLSPRGDWRMPSDADFQLWLDSLEE